MKKNLQKIDHIFFKALDNYGEEPDEKIWSWIENDLNRKDLEIYKARYRFVRRSIVIAILTTACLFVTEIVQLINPYYGAKNEITNLSPSKKRILEMVNTGVAKNHTGISNQEINADLSHSLNLYTKEEKEIINYQIFDHNSIGNKIEFKSLSFTYNVPITNLIGGNLSGASAPSSLAEKFSLVNDTQNLSSVKSGQSKTRSKHPFYLIPFGSLDHVSSKLEDEFEFNNENASDFARREKPDMSYTIGLLFEYGFSKTLSIQSGLSISNSFTSISPTVIKAFKDNSGQYKFKLATTYGLAEIKKTGIPQNDDSILLNGASLHLQYFSIPVIMKINLKSGKLNINATTGVALNKIIGDNAELNYSTTASNEIETIEKIEGLKNTFFSIVAGAEANYSINRNTGVSISPILRYAVTPVNQGTPVKTYPIIFGVGAAVHIKL